MSTGSAEHPDYDTQQSLKVMRELEHANIKIELLRAGLREIALTYQETEKTPVKQDAALYAVCRLAEHVLQKSTSQ